MTSPKTAPAGESGLLWEVSGGIDPADPCLDGHFPGQPIVPGAVLLGELAAGLAARSYALGEVRRAKFLHPLAPGIGFTISVSATPGSLPCPARVRWTADGARLAEASVTILPGVDRPSGPDGPQGAPGA